MILSLAVLFLALLVYAPQFWVQYVLRKYSRELSDLPGTGGELAQHLLSRFQLGDVKVEQTEANNDHYSPDDNAVRLSPTVYTGKSLTAVAVAAHEVGHAIQFNREEPVSLLRKRYLKQAVLIQRIGTGLLMFAPTLFAMLRVPHAFFLMAGIGLITMLASVFMYMAILPEEWDASFNKALPILIDGEYVKEEEIDAVRQILRACALTYVAGALADILRLWRWIAILRR